MSIYTDPITKWFSLWNQWWKSVQNYLPQSSVYTTLMQFRVSGTLKEERGQKQLLTKVWEGKQPPPPHTHSLRYVNCGFSCIHTYWVNFPQTWGAQLISPVSSTWVEPLKCADIYAGAYGAPLKNFDLPLHTFASLVCPCFLISKFQPVHQQNNYCIYLYIYIFLKKAAFL